MKRLFLAVVVAIGSTFSLNCTTASQGDDEAEIAHAQRGLDLDALAIVPPRAASAFQALAAADRWERLMATGVPEVIVGIKEPGANRGIWRDAILVSSERKASAAADAARLPGTSLIREDGFMPWIAVRVGSAEALETLIKIPWVDYVHPLRFQMQLSSGCDQAAYETASPTPPPKSDHSLRDTVPATWQSNYDDFVPWSFLDLLAEQPSGINPIISGHRIPFAWRRSGGGAGIRIAILDTGHYTTQTETLTTDQGSSLFDTGASTGRVAKYFNASGGVYADTCGHGTRAANTAAAPLNDTVPGSDTLVGAAWKANLTVAKVGDDVWLNGAGDYSAVVYGIGTAICNDYDVVACKLGSLPSPTKIIVSMAFGDDGVFAPGDDPWAVSDEINYWSQRGVLFLGAAGTTNWGFGCYGGLGHSETLFPASHENVLEVTCVDPSTGNRAAGVCDGYELAGIWSRDVPTGGEFPSDIWKFGGSSSCVSTVAGIAALVWAAHPTWQAADVAARLRQSGHKYPSRVYGVGYGAVDAFKGVGGLGTVSMSGPSRPVASAAYTINKTVSFGDGPLRYEWKDGACCTTSTRNCPACPNVGTCANGQSHPYCTSITRSAPSTVGASETTTLRVFDEGSLDTSEDIAGRKASDFTICATKDPATACGIRQCGSVLDGCGGSLSCGGCDDGFYCSGFRCAPLL